MSQRQPISDELISAFLDGELTAEEQATVEDHLVDNADARRMFDDLRRLRNRLQSLPAEKVSEDFSQRVMKRVRQADVSFVALDHADMEPADADAPTGPARAVDSAEREDKSSPPVHSAEPPRDGLWRGLIWAATAVAAVFLLMVLGRPPADHNRPVAIDTHDIEATNANLAGTDDEVVEGQDAARPNEPSNRSSGENDVRKPGGHEMTARPPLADRDASAKRTTSAPTSSTHHNAEHSAETDARVVLKKQRSESLPRPAADGGPFSDFVERRSVPSGGLDPERPGANETSRMQGQSGGIREGKLARRSTGLGGWKGAPPADDESPPKAGRLAPLDAAKPLDGGVSGEPSPRPSAAELAATGESRKALDGAPNYARKNRPDEGSGSVGSFRSMVATDESGESLIAGGAQQPRATEKTGMANPAKDEALSSQFALDLPSDRVLVVNLARSSQAAKDSLLERSLTRNGIRLLDGRAAERWYFGGGDDSLTASPRRFSTKAAASQAATPSAVPAAGDVANKDSVKKQWQQQSDREAITEQQIVASRYSDRERSGAKADHERRQEFDGAEAPGDASSRGVELVWAEATAGQLRGLLGDLHRTADQMQVVALDRSLQPGGGYDQDDTFSGRARVVESAESAEQGESSTTTTTPEGNDLAEQNGADRRRIAPRGESGMARGRNLPAPAALSGGAAAGPADRGGGGGPGGFSPLDGEDSFGRQDPGNASSPVPAAAKQPLDAEMLDAPAGTAGRQTGAAAQANSSYGNPQQFEAAQGSRGANRHLEAAPSDPDDVTAPQSEWDRTDTPPTIRVLFVVRTLPPTTPPTARLDANTQGSPPATAAALQESKNAEVDAAISDRPAAAGSASGP